MVKRLECVIVILYYPKLNFCQNSMWRRRE